MNAKIIAVAAVAIIVLAGAGGILYFKDNKDSDDE